MNQLVLIKEDMNPVDIVKYYFPDYDEDDIDYVLMEKTSYPFGELGWIAAEIYDYYLKNKRK